MKSRLNTFICNSLHEVDTFSLLGECGTNSSAHTFQGQKGQWLLWGHPLCVVSHIFSQAGLMVVSEYVFDGLAITNSQYHSKSEDRYVHVC